MKARTDASGRNVTELPGLWDESDCTPQAEITAIAPWFGAKRNLADRIVESVGKHVAYWEPFCGSMAVHDFATAEHERLSELLRRFRKSRVVVSYYDHPILPDLYPGWKRVETVVTKSLANAAGAHTKATEVLLVNEQRGMFE